MRSPRELAAQCRVAWKAIPPRDCRFSAMQECGGSGSRAGGRLVVVPSATTMLNVRSAVWIRKPAAAARPYPIVPSSGWFSFLGRWF